MARRIKEKNAGDLLFYTPWDDESEPTQSSVVQWLDHIYTRVQPLEQARWNEANMDTLVASGNSAFANQQFNMGQANSGSQFFFNLCHIPRNLVTGYQRQHRKSISYLPTEGSDPSTTDQYTNLITHCSQMGGLNEVFSKACEQACTSGTVLLQPYLDYSKDPAQGDLNLKLWEYNSYLMDPYWRNDINEASFVWTQEYISRREARERFGDRVNLISSSSTQSSRLSKFYFLPETNYMIRQNFLVVSYVWYKHKRKKPMLYNEQMNQFFDFAGGDGQRDEILFNMPGMQEVKVEVPTFKLCTVLNDHMMYNGLNPLGFDECPFVAVSWDREPSNNQAAFRDRSLIRYCRPAQVLFNHKVQTNNDIVESTINSGWKRKIGAVANEDNLKKQGQGWDILINDGFEMTDVDKIPPSGVPESNLALMEQMRQLIFATTGIEMENWSGQQDKQISSLTMMMKQSANLLVFQKYFDQWDLSLKQLGDLYLKVVLNKWSAAKVGLIIGEEPSPHFYSKIFAKYKVSVQEGLDTPTQQAYKAQQMLDINATFGREVIPASMIIKDMAIQGKSEILEFLEQQEQQQSAAQAELQNIQHTFEEAKLKEMYTRAMANLAMAKERMGRADSNIGLLEERISEISKNQSLSTKAKMEALEKLVDVVAKFGEAEVAMEMGKVNSMNEQEEFRDYREGEQAKRSSDANAFMDQALMQMAPPASEPQQMGEGMGQEMGQIPQNAGSQMGQEL